MHNPCRIVFLLLLTVASTTTAAQNHTGPSSNCFGDVCCPGQAISTNLDLEDEFLVCCVGNKNGGIDLTETSCTSGVAVPMTADDYDQRVAEVTAALK